MPDHVITVDNLVKNYGTFKAVRGISFQVQKGEIFGLLGENGAGKTTTLEIIEGLRRPSGGSIQVLGMDIHKNLTAMKEKIGVQLQSSAYYTHLTLREMLVLFGGFYRKHSDPDKLLEMVTLSDKADSFITQLSGGQRQRFSIVAALVNDPDIVFLDEPTTGLDPLARRNLWKVIASIKEQGKTVVLTTHYLEEAEMLCDHIALMDRGQIVAVNNTTALLEQAQFPYHIDFEIEKLPTALKEALEKFGDFHALSGKSHFYEVSLPTKAALNPTLDLIRKADPVSFAVRRASLEDVFIELTGHHIGEEADA